MIRDPRPHVHGTDEVGEVHCLHLALQDNGPLPRPEHGRVGDRHVLRDEDTGPDLTVGARADTVGDISGEQVFPEP